MTSGNLPVDKTTARVWQRMLSGRRLDLLDPSPLDVEIADIAHGLARVARWNGQTNGAHIFSVAQHTLLVEAVMREQMPRVDASYRLAALLHEKAAQQPLNRHPSSDIVYLRIERATFEFPCADQSIQPLERRIGFSGLRLGDDSG